MPVDVASEGARSAAASDPLARAHQALLHDQTLQFSFVVIKPPQPPAWLNVVGEVLKAIAPVMTWIFWIGLGVTALAILLFIGRELIKVRWPGRKTAKDAVEPAAWRPEPERARALLADADRLAAEGRYAEAAHLLLHRSIDDIDERRPRVVRPALTARDIARLEDLPAAARPAFAAIAAVVERSFFGGREVSQGEFQDCRRAYEDFAFPGAWA